MLQTDPPRQPTIFSRIVRWLSILAAALALLQVGLSCLAILLSNLWDWRSVISSVPPVVNDEGVNLDSLRLLSGLLLGISFFASLILLSVHILADNQRSPTHQRSHRSWIRSGIPLVLNLATALFVIGAADWDIHLDLQTNGKRRDVVQMIERQEVRSSIVESFTLLQGRLLSDSTMRYAKNVAGSTDQDLRVVLHLAPAYQHLARRHSSVEAIRRGGVMAIYFPLYEVGWFGAQFKGLLYQSNDAQPKTFGDETLHDVKRLQARWYLVYYDHSFN